MTDQDLIRTFEDRTLEPRTPAGETPSIASRMWTASQVAAYLDKRQQQLLKEAAPLVTHHGFSGDANTSLPVDQGQESVQLTPQTIDCIRCALVSYDTNVPPNVAGVLELPRESSWTLDQWQTNWESSQQGTQFYNEGLQTLPGVYLASPPSDKAGLDVVLVETSPTLDNSGIAIGMQDELSPYLLYGALADALGEAGEPNDPMRSKYCEQRWQEGVLLAKMMSNWFMRPSV